ncbi:hypothetical protein GCM10010836_34840 [Aminobacter aminovorans]
MAGRVPILGQKHVLAIADEVVNQRDDLVTAVHGKRTAGAKVVLKVDDNKRIRGHTGSILIQSVPPWQQAAEIRPDGALRQPSTWPSAIPPGSDPAK